MTSPATSFLPPYPSPSPSLPPSSPSALTLHLGDSSFHDQARERHHLIPKLHHADKRRCPSKSASFSSRTDETICVDRNHSRRFLLVLVVILLILYCYFWRSYAEKMGEGRKKSILKVLAGDKILYLTSPYLVNPRGGSGCDGGKMVFFDAGARRFELEDLVRASAKMLGKGGMGTAYKAVLEDGSVVTVKRLRDVGNGGMGRREVEERIEVLGGLRYGNVVGLRACYFSRELVLASSQESLLERPKVVALKELR